MAEFRLDLTKTHSAKGGASVEQKKVKIPKWLQNDTYSLSSRPRLPIDDLEEDGTALDTVRVKQAYRTKLQKRATKRLLEAEEFYEWLGNKRKRLK